MTEFAYTISINNKFKKCLKKLDWSRLGHIIYANYYKIETEIYKCIEYGFNVCIISHQCQNNGLANLNKLWEKIRRKLQLKSNNNFRKRKKNRNNSTLYKLKNNRNQSSRITQKQNNDIFMNKIFKNYKSI